ncbi:fibronectin type III domain-containing protein 11-like [Colossoma macropomum]|uniref:fibronectin type III domain-containing protein 11-like n=1 Tax=Colossoma macropomum TaxID=42526 RepID=UPI001864D836|nr:fibronectin type III domain-containing protein 11-like [Colossoma macropomum]
MENNDDPSKIQHHIRHILTKRLTPALLQTYNKKLELLRMCSFYIKVIQVDHSQYDHNCASSSTVMSLIDIQRFQRMKKLGNSQVKIQLALLEELLDSLSRGCEELQAILDRERLDEGAIKEGAIKEKIFKLLQEAAEFKDVLVPSRLHLKHHLISEVSSTRVPQIQLALSIRMPVRFDKTKCAASSDSIILHWDITEQEQHEPGEQFKICYKLFHPTTEAEGNLMAQIACASYCLRIDNLMPDRFYEFTVQRVDSWLSVYSLWIDAIILKTVSGTIGSSEENTEKN